MALSAGLFRDQDESDADHLNGPGWTIDQQQPSFFSNSLGAVPRGIGQGVTAGLSLLARGLEFSDQPSQLAVGPQSDLREAEASVGATPSEVPPWKREWNASLQGASDFYRGLSKGLNPDPRVTGTGANIIQGFGKAVTEFTAGGLAGGPLGGASLLGASEGYGRYQDLRDQGVDEDTATKAGTLEALTAGGSALLPMSLPAKWLAGLTRTGTLGVQALAGSAINTSFGVASRYGAAQILEDAGYPALAAQQKPIDEQNMLADAITGLFFGVHAGWHGLKGLTKADIDPAILDAAKVVQDRAEVAARAPGVSLDMSSAAVHRQALEDSLGSLLQGKDVDLAHLDTDGAAFARPEIDPTAVADIIRQHFTESGVLDDAAEFDRWLAGERETRPEPAIKTTEPVAEAVTEPRTQPEAIARPGEREPPTPGLTGALADRPDLQITNETGEPVKAAEALETAKQEEVQANREAEPMHQAAVACEARHA